MGEEIVPDMNIVNRARTEDLDRRVQYQVCGCDAFVLLALL